MKSTWQNCHLEPAARALSALRSRESERLGWSRAGVEAGWAPAAGFCGSIGRPEGERARHSTRCAQLKRAQASRASQATRSGPLHRSLSTRSRRASVRWASRAIDDLILVGSPTLGCAELRFVPNAEQTMGMPALSKHRWTAADVRALMDASRHWPRYELLDGELLVTNAPTLAHQWAVTELVASLRNYCVEEHVGVALVSPADIQLAPESIMQPDVFVVPRQLVPDDGMMQWPAVSELALAVEVLSQSTMREDRVRKRDFYLANRVGEYWIVDLDARVIERWTPERERPDIRRDELVWRPRNAAAPFLLDVTRFFADNPGLRRYV